MTTYLTITGLVGLSLLVGAGVLHLLPKLGSPGRAVSKALCHGFGLDLMITYFTVAPMIVGLIFGCWLGLIAAIAGQVIGLQIWVLLHEFANPEARKGPRIVHTLNRSVGRLRNHAALWVTAFAVPLFWFVRIGEWLIYPPLTWIIRLPPYKSSEWVNVSRQKFDGLVGHDLIWCLYCDWMTGVWSLGTEMLRNVETFWCPIRFYSDKKCDTIGVIGKDHPDYAAMKCDNCSIDFPDVNNGWIDNDGDMGDVVKLLEEKHAEGNHSWFGHPSRITVEGKEQQPPADKVDETPES